MISFDYAITTDDENAESFVQSCEGLLRNNLALFVPSGSIDVAAADGAEGTVEAGAFETASVVLSAESSG